MTHKQMLNDYLVKPLWSAFSGTLEYATTKLVMLLAGFPGVMFFDLFKTPYKWWVGLLALVIMDWTAGMIRAARAGNFNWTDATRKWYQTAGYIYACGAVAVLSNTFPNLFYYLQFAVYATFFLKEFVSILETFNLLELISAGFSLMWDIINPTDGIKFKDVESIYNEIKRRSEEEK